jgi:hypothetical protein
MTLPFEILGGVLILISMWLTGGKNLLAPSIGIMGCLVLAGIYVYQGNWGLLAFEGTGIALYAKQHIQWRRDKRQSLERSTTEARIAKRPMLLHRVQRRLWRCALLDLPLSHRLRQERGPSPKTGEYQWGQK